MHSGSCARISTANPIPAIWRIAPRFPAIRCNGAFVPSGDRRINDGPCRRCCCIREPALRAARDGGVPGRRHRDQRAGARALRADRGRRGAGRRRRAARPLVLAGRRVGAAVARDPALHRDLAGDGRPGAAAGGGAARAGPAAARARAGRALGALRHSACCAGRSRARRWTGPSRRCCARSRWRAGSRRCSAAAASRRWPTRSGSRSRRRTARCPTQRPARACSARCSRA